MHYVCLACLMTLPDRIPSAMTLAVTLTPDRSDERDPLEDSAEIRGLHGQDEH